MKKGTSKKLSPTGIEEPQEFPRFRKNLEGYYGMEKLNSSQLSKAFQVSKVTIRNWIDKGCPSTKTDKGHEFILSDVIKWHQSRYLKSVEPDEFQKSKATREHFKALLTELEYKERSADLISAQDVKELMFSTARLTRDAILNIPGRLSAILANQNREKINEMLTKELRQALENLASKFCDLVSLEEAENESLEDKKLCQN